MKRFTILFLLFVFTKQLCAQNSSVRSCGYLPAGKLKIYYCEQGAGPAVILLHAGFLDMHIWDNQVDSLSKTHRVILMDLPGHGQSGGIDTTIRIADVINQLMKHLKVATASFAGISLGATCAVDFAIAYPEKTSKLVLLSPGLNGWEHVLKSDTISKRQFLRDDIF